MNYTNPLVTVIIPAYNTEKYINKCLMSVLHQTHGNIEVIVVDDGSQDALYKVVEKYVVMDDRVELIRQDNKGAAGARNTGLKKAKGDYIFFLDSDDWIETNTIELLVKKAQTQNSDIVMPDRYTKVKLNGKKSVEYLFIDYERYDTIPDFVVNIIIGQGRAWRVTSVLYRADIIRNHKIEFPLGYTAEDVVFNLKFLSRASKISFLREPTLNVVKRKDSVTSTYKSNKIKTYLLIDKKAREYVKEIRYDHPCGIIAVNSLLCRNIVVLILSEMSPKNKKGLNEKIKIVNSILDLDKVKRAFEQEEFIYPYWNSKTKIYYVRLIRWLISHDFECIAILLTATVSKLRNMVLINEF